MLCVGPSDEQTVSSPKRAKTLEYDDPESEVKSEDGEYLIAYSLGTPKTNTFGTIDTGSNLIWLQCTPCDKCFDQRPDKFNESTTYIPVGCKTSLCRTTVWLTVADISCDKSKYCQYEMAYRDGSVSKGKIAHDTLTLGSTSGGKVSFPKTVFGRGCNNSGFFCFETPGIVGFGRGPLSLISQLGYTVKGKFSYCLVPIMSDKSSKLSFGKNAIVSGADTVSIPIVLQGVGNKYYLTLEGISVRDKRLNFIPGDDSVLVTFYI